MSNIERLQAVGSRGEACIIVRTTLETRAPSNSGEAPLPEANVTYALATGERLRQTDDPKVFETRDGSRRFTLR